MADWENVLHRNRDSGIHEPARAPKDRPNPGTRIYRPKKRTIELVPTTDVIPFTPELVGKPIQQAIPARAPAVATNASAGAAATGPKRPCHHHGPARRIDVLRALVPDRRPHTDHDKENEAPQPLARPAVLHGGAAHHDQQVAETSALDIILDRAETVTIPPMTSEIRASLLQEGVAGWAAHAKAIAEAKATTLRAAMHRDDLLTQAQMNEPARYAAAAKIAPYVPLEAVARVLGMTESPIDDTDAALALMLAYLTKWCVSTIEGAVSAWTRLHWLAHHLGLPPSETLAGPTLAALFKCVAVGAKAKAAAQANPAPGPGSRNGSTAETQVRNGLIFVKRNMGVEIPNLACPLVIKWKMSQREPTDSALAIPIRSLYRMEAAAIGLLTQESGDLFPEIVRQTLAMLEALALGCLRSEQSSCSEIWSFNELVEGCFAGCTDREKSNQPHKMKARPFWMVATGLINAEWARIFETATHECQLGGIFVRENDSPDGDPFRATKLYRRPMEKQRMRTCLWAILMKIGDIPAAEISKYGISSLRKFLPELGKARRIGTAR